MLDKIYAALKLRLAEEVPDLKEIDWYLGQYDETDPDIQNWYTSPAAYLEWDPIQWASIGMYAQAADATLNVHIVNATLYDNDQRILDAANNHFGLEREVFRALHGWRVRLIDLEPAAPPELMLCETLVRRETIPDHSLRRSLVSIQRFTTRIYDYSAVPEYEQIVAQLNLTAQLADEVTPPFRKP